MRLAGQAKGGFYPTPPKVINLIARIIGCRSMPYRSQSKDVIRILDPCCGAGEALEQLTGSLRTKAQIPVITYGVELHNERAQAAAQLLDHTLSADLFQTSMANEAFSMLYLNPPYDHDEEKKRVEQSFLAQCTRYLAPGGVLAFIVPRERASTSARFLANWYSNIGMWDFPPPEQEDFGQAVVAGVRKKDPVPDTGMEKEIRSWSRGNERTFGQKDWPLYTAYQTPALPGGDILFATRSVDPEAAIQEARVKGLLNNPKVTDQIWPHQNVNTRPLMPLRRGHLAMLIAAGFLNNACLEGPGGERILVKGQTTKERILAEETEEEEVFRDRLKTTVMALNLQTGEISHIQSQPSEKAPEGKPEEPEEVKEPDEELEEQPSPDLTGAGMRART